MRLSFSVIILIGIRFNNPLVLQILTFNSDKYLDQTNFQQRIKTTINIAPIAIKMIWDIIVLWFMDDSISANTYKMGVSIYFVSLSYSSIFEILVFWGTEVGYIERIDLRSSSTLTTPVLSPFVKTPEFKLEHSAVDKTYLKIA